MQWAAMTVQCSVMFAPWHHFRFDKFYYAAQLSGRLMQHLHPPPCHPHLIPCTSLPAQQLYLACCADPNGEYKCNPSDAVVTVKVVIAVVLLVGLMGSTGWGTNKCSSLYISHISELEMVARWHSRRRWRCCWWCTSSCNFTRTTGLTSGVFDVKNILSISGCKRRDLPYFAFIKTLCGCGCVKSRHRRLTMGCLFVAGWTSGLSWTLPPLCTS